MKVLFLGAGSSLSAGYPPGSTLLEELRGQANRTPSAEVQGGWSAFEEFVSGAQGSLKRILNNPNPEVVLTLLDLLRAARESEHQDWWSLLKLWGQPVEPGVLDRLENPPWRDEPEEFAGVEPALRGLLDYLDHYFWWKHVQDQRAEAAPRRFYLAREVEGLQPGDFVITTNWDTLLERVLLEAGLWTPINGYGFGVDLVTSRRGERLPEALEASASVKLLKLHGSFGWYLNRNNRIYLSKARFLQHLPLRDGDSEFLCEDAAEPVRKTSSEPRAFVYPTYLKRLEYPQLQTIWALATDALHRATEFHAIGYSLPASDTPIRVLLNPLRARHEKGEVEILVDDPDPQARERWQLLLGQRITVRPRAIGSLSNRPAEQLDSNQWLDIISS